MIPFNKPSITQLEKQYLHDAIENSILSGDGKYTKKVYDLFAGYFGIENMLLTTSGTDALELAFLSADLQPDDEVITPSFTFSSTVNAFMLRGARPVFCDVREDTYNIDESNIEALITPKTKVIVSVDYAGVPCEVDTINEIAKRHNILHIIDAAQSVGSTYRGRFSGTLAPISCFSFHETKNYIMGEGGAVVYADSSYMEKAEIFREKGTNRRHVIRGLVDKYTWHSLGSSFLPSDLLAALLAAQMERFDEILQKRLHIWNMYHRELEAPEIKGKLRRPRVPGHISHNGHMYNILLPDGKTRARVIEGLKEQGVSAYICYMPLHSAPFGRANGFDRPPLPVTEMLGECLLRLPLWTDMKTEQVMHVCRALEKIL